MTLAAFDSDHKEPYFIDRIPYDKLYELLANMAPTLVAMEPCSGAHQIAEQIQALGHEVMMISGRHVQAWVKDHCNGQKTDLNDAFAILNLAYDRWLTPIRGKTREECRLLALQASYRPSLSKYFLIANQEGTEKINGHPISARKEKSNPRENPFQGDYG